MNPLTIRRLGLALVVAPTLAGCRCCRPRASPCAEPVTIAAPMPNLVAAAPAASGPSQVLVQIQVFELTERAALRLHVGEAAKGQAYGGVPAKAGEELAASLRNEEGVSLLNLPAIVTSFGDEASILVGDTVGPDVPGRTGTPPLTFAGGENWTGLRAATIVQSPAADGTLSVDFTVARRDAPAKGTEPDLAAIRASELSVQALKMGLRSGETAVLASPAGPGSTSGRLLVLVRLTVVPETAAR